MTVHSAYHVRRLIGQLHKSIAYKLQSSSRFSIAHTFSILAVTIFFRSLRSRTYALLSHCQHDDATAEL